MAKISKASSVTFTILMLFVATFSPMFNPVHFAFAQDTTIPESSESPLSLKLSAIAQLSIVNGSGSDQLIFDQVKADLKKSVDNDFYDNDHIKNPLAVKNDQSIIEKLLNTTAYIDSSDPSHKTVVSCVVDIVQSDRRLSSISISDAYDASLQVKEPSVLKLLNGSLRLAKKDWNVSESYLQVRNMTGAAQYYGASWAEANLGLLLADSKISPTVNVAYPTNGSYVSTSYINVSGTVNDVAVYKISNVTMTVNGRSTVVPLIGGKFDQQIQLLEGENVIRVTANDVYNNKGKATSVVTLDTVRPIITITGVTDGGYYNSSVQPVVIVSDINSGKKLITLDGASYDGSLVSDDGVHLLHVETTDPAGNIVNEDVSFVIDRTPPVATLFGMQVNSYKGQTVLIDGGMVDANPGSLSLRIDGIGVSTRLPYSWNSTSYRDGNHTIELYVLDKAGNYGSTSTTVIIDNTPPNVKILVPKNSTLFISNLVKFAWGGSDNYGISFYRLFLDNILIGNTTNTNSSANGLTEGSHQAVVEAYDVANNSAADVVDFIIDTTPPSINISNIEEGKRYNYNVTPDINVTDANLNFTTITLNGAPYTGGNISGNGLYTLYVYAEDLAGNSNITTINFSIYTVLPLLSVKELTDNPTLASPCYNLTGRVDEDAILTINGVVIPHDESFNYSTNVTEGVNNFIVNTMDAAGNVASWNKTRLVDSDKLPDYYEINVTQTDPLNGDTDGNGINDSTEDFDNDLLPNYAEYKLGTDPFNPDTDGDGLTDFFEFFKSGTSPLKVDTFGNGINDSALDMDNDGLTNLQEQALGTNPRYNDSDGDGLSDYDEVYKYHTSPKRADIDGDGLTDDLEVAVGADPFNHDSDNNGILDGSDSFKQIFSDDSLGVSLTIVGSAFIQKTMKIQKDLNPYAPLAKLPGVVTDFININTSSKFDTATVRLYYDEFRLNGFSESNLKLYYYDGGSESIVKAPNQRLDTDSNFIEVKAKHLGVWFIVDDSLWATASQAKAKQDKIAKSVMVTTKKAASSTQLVVDSAQMSTMQSSDPMTFDIGDNINIRAQVFNDGNAPVTQDVLVSFYEGDPNVGGTRIGNATITGGIANNSSKTAILNGYTITSAPVDIYVKVDPLNNISESDKSDNIAYQVLTIGSQDSDGDGLTDAEEIGGMYDERSHSLIYTDPYSDDTDEDGVKDGVEMGPRQHDDYSNAYYYVICYPDYGHSDSDNDGLTDYKELYEHPVIQVVNTHENAIGFLNSLHNDDNPALYMSDITVTSDVMNSDTDGDGIKDGAELNNRTNPGSPDTDNDGILDNQEDVYEDDPSIYDTTGPLIIVTNMDVYRVEGTLLKTRYEVSYTVSDPAGISSITVVKDGVVQPTPPISGHITALGTTTMFDTDWIDTIFDEFEATRVDINAVDDWGSPSIRLAYLRSSMWGQLAEALTGSDDIYNDSIALSLGMLSGWTYALAQFPELAAQLCHDFVGTVAVLATFTAVATIPEAQSVLLLMIGMGVIEMQETENPYDSVTQPGLYSSYAGGWYAGFLVMSALTIEAGKDAFKYIASSPALSAIATRITTNYGDVVQFLLKAKKLGVKGEIEIGFSTKPKRTGVVDGELLFTKVDIGAAKAHVWQEYIEELTPETRAIADIHKPEAGAVLKGMTTGDVAAMNSMDGLTLERILSFNGNGVPEESLTQFRTGLLKINRLGLSDTELNEYISNMDMVKSRPGAFTRSSTGDLQTLASRAETSARIDNYKSLFGETRVAAYFEGEGRLVEIGPNDGIIDLRLLGESGGNAVGEVKTSTVPLTGEKAADLAGKARHQFVNLKNKGALTNERKICIIDATEKGFADPANGLNNVKNGLNGIVKIWQDENIIDIVDEFDLLIRDEGSPTGYNMVKGDVTVSNIGGNNVYTLTWRS